nr:MAG TPA: hypothetical protein [Caudoviricetes sp.]
MIWRGELKGSAFPIGFSTTNVLFPLIHRS